MRCYRILASFIWLWVIFLVSCINAQTSLDKPLHTTVCQIAKHCGPYDGKIVRFRASVLSDWFENIILSDPACEGGVMPLFSEEALEKRDVLAFHNELLKGKPGDLDLLITATFTGRISCESNLTNKRSRTIQIEKVENLEVKRTENPFLKRMGLYPPPKELFDKP
jgi:hypothetical protein